MPDLFGLATSQQARSSGLLVVYVSDEGLGGGNSSCEVMARRIHARQSVIVTMLPGRKANHSFQDNTDEIMKSTIIPCSSSNLER